MPRLHVILLGVLALVLAALGAGWWWMAVGRYPLRGDLRHDFGDVPLHGRAASVHHTFTLRNVTEEPVVILGIARGCGCTDVQASTMNVESGGTVDFDVTLNLTKAGHKRTDVTLNIEDFGIQKLWLQAVARQGTALTKNQHSIDLVEGQTVPVSFFADLQDTDDQPPQPAIEAPHSVSAAFVGWQLVQERDRARRKPARWRGRMQVTLEKDDLPADPVLTLRVDEAMLEFPIATPRTPAPPVEGRHRELAAPGGESSEAPLTPPVPDQPQENAPESQPESAPDGR